MSVALMTDVCSDCGLTNGRHSSLCLKSEGAPHVELRKVMERPVVSDEERARWHTADRELKEAAQAAHTRRFEGSEEFWEARRQSRVEDEAFVRSEAASLNARKKSRETEAERNERLEEQNAMVAAWVKAGRPLPVSAWTQEYMKT